MEKILSLSYSFSLLKGLGPSEQFQSELYKTDQREFTLEDGTVPSQEPSLKVQPAAAEGATERHS